MICRPVLFLVLVGVALGQKRSHEDELRSFLMKNYNPEALPATETVVVVRFTALHFTMNEDKQSLDLDVWMSMEWTDPRLEWDKRAYPDVKRLSFRRDSVWHPDLTLYNNAISKEMDIYASSQILAFDEGRIIWVPPAHAKASCVMDMTYWPHDIHNCTAKFGSWVHSTNTVNMKLKDDVVNFEKLEMYNNERNLSRGEWKILGTKVYREGKIYDCCPEEYVTLNVVMVVQREAPAYTWLVKMPCVVLSLLTVVVFLLPPSSGEKVLVGGIALGMDFFFLLSISQLIGHSANHTPLIVELVGKQLLLTGVSVIVSAIILRLVRDPHNSGFPIFLRVPLLALSSCLCLGGYRQMVSSTLAPFSRSMKGEDLELNEGGNGRGGIFAQASKGVSGDGEWLLLAAVVDRFCLLIFTIIFLINMICYSQVL